MPLPGLMVPLSARADTPVAIAICGGGEERAIAIPARESPSRRNDDQQACAHLACPRDRGQAGTADDDEE